AGAQGADTEGEQPAIDVECEQIGFVEGAGRAGVNSRQAGITAGRDRQDEVVVGDIRRPACIRQPQIEAHGTVTVGWSAVAHVPGTCQRASRATRNGAASPARKITPRSRAGSIGAMATRLSRSAGAFLVVAETRTERRD